MSGRFLFVIVFKDMEQQEKKPFYKRMWFIVLIVVFVLYLIGSSASDTSQMSQTPTDTVNTPTKPQQREAIKVTAQQLVQEYEDNEVSADAKYEGNLVQVSGIVDSIGKDILDSPYITLKGKQYSINRVQCMFSKRDAAILATVSKDESITLEGTLTGYTILNPLIEDCHIVR